MNDFHIFVVIGEDILKLPPNFLSPEQIAELQLVEVPPEPAKETECSNLVAS